MADVELLTRGAFVVGMISFLVVLLVATSVVAFLVLRWAWQALSV